MKVITAVKEMRALANLWQKESLGFVPTMGALHKGHLSLVEASLKENQKTVVSIFVNPLQFLPSEDFAQYPRNQKADLALLEALGVDVVFMPTALEIYPEAEKTSLIQLSKPALINTLCGLTRPGHFEGVITILSKLFEIVHPQQVYFGQKDFQQCVVVRQLIDDLKLNINFRMLPTVREEDGLAMSSRNAYLIAQPRVEACLLFESLQKIKELFEAGVKNVDELVEAGKTILQRGKLVKIDYLEILKAKDLQKVDFLTEDEYVVAVACYLGHTRLIDNILIGHGNL